MEPGQSHELISHTDFNTWFDLQKVAHMKVSSAWFHTSSKKFPLHLSPVLWLCQCCVSRQMPRHANKLPIHSSVLQLLFNMTEVEPHPSPIWNKIKWNVFHLKIKKPHDQEYDTLVFKECKINSVSGWLQWKKVREVYFISGNINIYQLSSSYYFFYLTLSFKVSSKVRHLLMLTSVSFSLMSPKFNSWFRKLAMSLTLNK